VDLNDLYIQLKGIKQKITFIIKNSLHDNFAPNVSIILECKSSTVHIGLSGTD